MRPSLEELAAACPTADVDLLREHLDRLDASYFETFRIEEIADHLKALGSLSTREPCDAIVTRLADGRVDCTIIAYDYPSVFSLISGVLAGSGFSVLSGDVFTYARVAERTVPRRGLKHRRRVRPKSGAANPRRIIDHFIGTLETPGTEENLQRELMQTLNALHDADESTFETARNRVHELVAAHMVRTSETPATVLLPIDLDIDNGGSTTRFRVRSQDTPAFLYSLSIVLVANRIRIEKIRIRTKDGQIEDDIYVLAAGGHKIQEPGDLDPLKFAVLLTKQFSYQLSRAPDPSAALRRYELMIGDLLKLPESGQWVELLSQPAMLRDLARILGASEFIWEDFVRVQYESLLPILMPHVRGASLRKTREQLRRELSDMVKRAPTLEARRDAINEFKDDEAYTIDLSHIVDNAHDPRQFAEALTELIELVIDEVVSVELNALVQKHGTPRTVGNLDARFALFGLGKLGGVALGYASDIELLFVYSDSGHTDGEQTIQNADFFEQLARNITNAIRSKREGIFRIDLRLRPHGNKGPLACSLDNFIRYYGPGGHVHSFERLALVRLRAIGGDPEFGARIERLRDDFIYRADSIDLAELRSLRLKQFQEKDQPGRYNAKFSPGGLVDLEYDVQILQVMHGAEHTELRTPRIHQALVALAEKCLLERAECDQLTDAYYFLRRLINGLRMLRGSAQDLLLPATESFEFAHLARRMGYERGAALRPEEQLHLDFETHTAVIRKFVEDHFGREALPGPPRGSIADVVFSHHPDVFAPELFTRAGFNDPVRCVKNVEGLARAIGDRHQFAPLAVLAFEIISRTPYPDMALNNWERHMRAVDRPREHAQHLLAQPKRLEILLDIFAASQFLAETLIQYPEFFDWVTDPELLHSRRTRNRLKHELIALGNAVDTHGEWLHTLRRFRRREILRIGTRDICLKAPMADITDELSALGDAVVAAALARIVANPDNELDPESSRHAGADFCVLALGKLGGGELNYSSDIDLVAVCSADAEPRDFEPVMEQLRSDLAMHTDAGIAYRVDLRLRPYGRSGSLVHRLPRLLQYYVEAAGLWEIQALLKLRYIAGDATLAEALLKGLRPLLETPRSLDEIATAIDEMRNKAVRKLDMGSIGKRDIKSGLGGIRDAEFLIQGLQLKHLAKAGDLLEGNTLRAADKLAAHGLLPADVTEQLKEDYIFLRRVEHCLQILEDRQVHALPRSGDALEALARRVMGPGTSGADLLTTLDACQERVRAAYKKHLGLPTETTN